MTTQNGFVFGKYAETLLSGTGALAMLTDTAIKVALIDLDDIGVAVTAATNASPSVITTGSAHGLSVGDRCYIQGALGNTAINGLFIVNTVPTSTTMTINNIDGTAVNGNGTWTSGGRVHLIDTWQFYNAISAAAVGTPVAMATSGRSYTGGVFKGPTTTLTGVSGDPTEAYILYKDTGTASTSPLICMLIASFTPNGSNVDVSAPNGWFAIT